jgi:hypothetical protein
VIVAGSNLDDDTVARWAYAIRFAVGAMPVATYRRGGPRVRMRTTGTRLLPAGPGEALRRILEMADGERHLPSAEPGQAGGARRSVSL